MTEPPIEAKAAERRKPTLGQRAVAYAFIGAFAATMATVILTGLEVRSPSARRLPETAAVTLAIGEPRIVNLVFDAPTALRDVEFTVDLPPGIEIEGRPGQRRVLWRTELTGGHNVLPLSLVAREGRGGQLAARLRLGADQKTFVVDLTVAPH